jgi:uncharacterized phage-associated protein
MKHPFLFDPEKAVETILYIANKVQGADFHRISKLMYFADKIRLEEAGRFICGDSYMAMKHGPVPCKTYDILKSMRGDGLSVIESAKISFTVFDTNIVKPLREADLDYFSDSDLECLDKVISRQKFLRAKTFAWKSEYGELSFWKLTELSHDSAWQSADENDCIEIEQIVGTIANAELLLEHLKDRFPG